MEIEVKRKFPRLFPVALKLFILKVQFTPKISIWSSMVSQVTLLQTPPLKVYSNLSYQIGLGSATY